MRTPPRPFGDSAKVAFDQWVWDRLVSLTPRAAPGVLTDHTTKGVFRRGQNLSTFRLPPGIEVREVKICKRTTNTDGTVTTQTLYRRVLCSVPYDKNDDGEPIDSDNNVLDETTDPPLPDLSGTDQLSGWEEE